MRKKLLSLVLIVCYMTLVCLNVNAANFNPHTITIKSEKYGHTFEAYQIFKGDLSNEKLTNVEWGLSIVDPTNLLNELKTLNIYMNCENAMDVSKVLETASAQEVDDFASIVSKYMNSAPVGSANKGVVKQDGLYHYTMTVAGDGYYLVKDREHSVSGNDAYTKYILQVVGDVSVEAKSDYPTLVKKLSDGLIYNQVAVGDVVDFVLESSVPNMDGYNRYYFVIEDVFGLGFTFNNDVVVQLGENELVKDEDYVVNVNEDRFEIVFDDFIDYVDLAGNSILVTYSCVLDEDAVSGVSGNSNQAVLTYSNHPNYEYEGDDVPLNNEPVGVTPASSTYTYMNDLVITKIDGNSGELLSGAKFKISGSNLNKVQVKEAVYSESENGTYFKLNDGSYTLSLPTDATSSLYDSLDKKYELSYVVKYVDTKSGEEAIGVVDESGTLVFKGLSAGTYSITEIEAPEGYNKLENPIRVTIGWEEPIDSNECIWSINNNPLINGITVENYAGTVLPSTGGMGTVIFYLVGTGFVLLGFILNKKK